VAARESSLLSPSGSKAGKAHRVPISSQEAFFLSGRVQEQGGMRKPLLLPFIRARAGREPALAPNSESNMVPQRTITPSRPEGRARKEPSLRELRSVTARNFRVIPSELTRLPHHRVKRQAELPVARGGPAPIPGTKLGRNVLNQGNWWKRLVSNARGEAAVPAKHRKAQQRRLRLPNRRHLNCPHPH
jgi:hypothetical protein